LYGNCHTTTFASVVQRKTSSPIPDMDWIRILVQHEVKQLYWWDRSVLHCVVQRKTCGKSHSDISWLFTEPSRLTDSGYYSTKNSTTSISAPNLHEKCKGRPSNIKVMDFTEWGYFSTKHLTTSIEAPNSHAKCKGSRWSLSLTLTESGCSSTIRLISSSDMPIGSSFSEVLKLLAKKQCHQRLPTCSSIRKIVMALTKSQNSLIRWATSFTGIFNCDGGCQYWYFDSFVLNLTPPLGRLWCCRLAEQNLY